MFRWSIYAALCDENTEGLQTLARAYTPGDFRNLLLSAAGATVSNGMALERAKKLLAPFIAPEAVNEFERDILAHLQRIS